MEDLREIKIYIGLLSFLLFAIILSIILFSKTSEFNSMWPYYTGVMGIMSFMLINHIITLIFEYREEKEILKQLADF